LSGSGATYFKLLVEIGKSAKFANRVSVSDSTHGYEDKNIPICNHIVKVLKDITIGMGSRIGENVYIQGANIGRHCIIGSNSVVTRDIPDCSVSVGIPARVIKHYDSEHKCWIR